MDIYDHVFTDETRVPEAVLKNIKQLTLGAHRNDDVYFGSGVDVHGYWVVTIKYTSDVLADTFAMDEDKYSVFYINKKTNEIEFIDHEGYNHVIEDDDYYDETFGPWLKTRDRNRLLDI